MQLNRPSLDLTKRMWVRQSGSLVIYGTWFGTHQGDSEPCLAIVRHPQPMGMKPAVVALSVAHKWAEDGAHAAHASAEFCVGLRLEPTKTNCFQLCNLILDNLGDLLKMPPMPSDTSLVMADAVATIDGKEIRGEIVHKV